jgi:GDP-L-fucose synthase
MINLKDRKVVVTGGLGMIGQALIPILLEKGAVVDVVALDDPSLCPKNVNYIKADLTDFDNCMSVFRGASVVFNLIGIKTNPKKIQEQPADIIIPYLRFNTNTIEAARRSKIDWFLYTSSIGVYGFSWQSNFEKESNYNTSLPSLNDKFGGWAKRMGEMTIEAIVKQDKVNKFSIVRPANVFGPFDDFSENSGMVIPSLMSRIRKREDPFTVWGDGSSVRDFVSSSFVAKAMVFMVENEITEATNIGSGRGVSISQLLEVLFENADFHPKVVFDKSKPNGDYRRVLSNELLRKHGFTDGYDLKKELKDTYQWYLNNFGLEKNRYNVFL